MLGDDAVITVPTKDIVFFTKASDRKLRKKMMKMAENMFLMNTKESPYLLFSKDIFLYSRKENRIQIIGQR